MRLVAILLLASPAVARVCESSDVARRSRTPDPKLTAAGFSGEFERPIVDWKIKGCFSLNAEGVDAAGAKLLVPYLRSNRDLMQLHFLGSSLGDAGCKAIASVLERNLWINVLTLHADGLRTNPHIGRSRSSRRATRRVAARARAPPSRARGRRGSTRPRRSSRRSSSSGGRASCSRYGMLTVRGRR